MSAERYAGMTWGWTGSAAEWKAPEAQTSMAAMAEAGCPSRLGSPARPNDWTLEGPVSLAAQDAYYAEMFEATAARAWFGGFMLWDWPARLYARDEAAANDNYCIYGKPAEARVTEYYRVLTEGRRALTGDAR